MDIYNETISLKNLIFAYKKARKGKTKKDYVIKFEENLAYNLKILYDELKNETYKPKPLQSFILRDPKTRKISKSDFRDRIVHHALCNILEPIFEKVFIYDSCANRKNKGTLFALQRFGKFQRKVTHNLSKQAFCFKADIKHYFQEINRDILLKILEKKIKCSKTINLIQLILNNFESKKGMPLGNLTSQFFANVYLNELDYFVKHELKVKYYLRYVDDFVILHKSKEQLKIWKEQINYFLESKLKLELHTEKSKIINLSSGLDFVGFRNFYYFKLLRKRNILQIIFKIELYKKQDINNKNILDVFQGWNACAKWANSFGLRIILFLILII
ncbi:MAG: reverse transcriptase domain-containing protein [Candidatus Pacearchaeota archaeon]|jgi:retron-type reverse transcriptase